MHEDRSVLVLIAWNCCWDAELEIDHGSSAQTLSPTVLIVPREPENLRKRWAGWLETRRNPVWPYNHECLRFEIHEGVKRGEIKFYSYLEPLWESDQQRFYIVPRVADEIDDSYSSLLSQTSRRCIASRRRHNVSHIVRHVWESFAWCCY